MCVCVTLIAFSIATWNIPFHKVRLQIFQIPCDNLSTVSCTYTYCLVDGLHIKKLFPIFFRSFILSPVVNLDSAVVMSLFRDCTSLRFIIWCGTRGGAVGLVTVLQSRRWRVRFPMVTVEFSIDLILPAVLCSPGIDSASKTNQYQEYFLGGTEPSRVDCLEIWEPQPAGTPWNCTGILIEVIPLCLLQNYKCVYIQDVSRL